MPPGHRAWVEILEAWTLINIPWICYERSFSESKASVVCSATAAIFIDFCLKKLNVFSERIGKKTNEYLNSAEQIPRNWNVDQLSVFITSWDIAKWCSTNLLWKELMERISQHTGLISSYQLLITAACTNTGGKMKGSHSRAADQCPFVLRHSLSQVNSFMQVGMLWYKDVSLEGKGNPIVEIRQSDDHLFSTIGFLSLVRWKLYIETWPWFCIYQELVPHGIFQVEIRQCGGHPISIVEIEHIIFVSERLHCPRCNISETLITSGRQCME